MTRDLNDLLARIHAVAEQRTSNEPAHDWLHVLRVEALAARIARVHDADGHITCAAALLHEVFTLPKDHPDSARAGELCAQQARDLLLSEGAPDEFLDRVTYCIRVHAFSAGIEPETLEAKVLQDADRLDAIGAIGIARCFATCAAMGRPFYDARDPFAQHRELDDKSFGLDHFERKLLQIPQRLHTEEALRIGRQRAAFIATYLEQLRSEIA